MKKFVKNPHNHDDLVLLDREMLFAGYTCKVACNYREAGTTDPWSGMPDIDNDFTYFDNAEEAANFAKTQLWPFNHDVTSRVEPLTLGETWDEMREREAKEAAAKKAAKEAKEAEKAKAAGLTVDEYRAAKKEAAKVKAYQKEIEKINAEIAELEKRKAWYEAELKKRA